MPRDYDFILDSSDEEYFAAQEAAYEAWEAAELNRLDAMLQGDYDDREDSYAAQVQRVFEDMSAPITEYERVM